MSPYEAMNHTHSCMATEWTPDTPLATEGVQLVVSIGDGLEHNRFIRFTMPNHTLDYTATPDPWAAQDEYHGRAGADATQSMQPGACFFGPEANTIIWTTDLEAEWLSLMRLPNGGQSPDQARFEHLYGWATGFGHDALTGARSRPVFQGLSQPRPEVVGHPMAVVYDEEERLAGAIFDARRILFCPDSTKPREWVQVAAMHDDWRGPTVALSRNSGTDFLYLGATEGGIWRTPIPSATSNPPTLRSIRPMLVAPGGRNLLHETFLIEQKDAQTFNDLVKDSGLSPPWQDNGRPLPSPPSMAGRAVRMRTRHGDNSGWAGNVRLSSSLGGTTWHNLPSGSTWTEGTRVRRLRGWLLDSSHDRSLLPSPLTPNKTMFGLVRLWDETTAGTGHVFHYSCDDRWSPCTIIMPRAIGTNLGLGLRFNAYGSVNDADKEENYGFFLPDLALDGNGSLPYPMLPNAAGPIAPDELLTLTGLTLTTEQSWSLKVAGMMPVANWDHHAARGVWNELTQQFESDRRWPLCTLWADSDNWIEFSADCEGEGFRVRVRANGAAPTTHDFGDSKQIWLPDSPLLLGIGHVHTPGTPPSRTLYVGASLGGGLVRVEPDGTSVPWSGKTFTELRFRGAAPGGVSNDGEVCEFRWIGGEVSPASTLTNSTLPSAFTDLGFLSGP